MAGSVDGETRFPFACPISPGRARPCSLCHRAHFVALPRWRTPPVLARSPLCTCCPPDELYALAESVGVSPDPEIFSLLLELIRRDVKTSVIVQMLRSMKDTKIRSALSRQSPTS